jgi:hypothetical protein
MTTLQEKARKRLLKWRAKRFKFREIASTTGVSEGLLCAIMKDEDRAFKDWVAVKILDAQEPDYAGS